MDAFELYNEHHQPTGVWCCGKCRRMILSYSHEPLKPETHSSRESAEACCRPPVCETCGKEFERPAYYSNTECEPCRDAAWKKRREEQHQKHISEAEDISGAPYEGMVFVEDSRGDGIGGREGFHDSIADVADDILENEFDRVPEWAFACEPRHERLDIDDMIERLCDDGYEDMASNLTITKALRDAVEDFNTINAKWLAVWEVDYTRKIRIPVPVVSEGEE